MTTASSRSSLLHVISVASALLALAEMTACGESADAALAPLTDAALDQVQDASVAESPDAAELPDRAVEVFERGAGDVTVVFESGLGDDLAKKFLDAGTSLVDRESGTQAFFLPSFGITF